MELDAKTIQKYSKKSVTDLKKLAQKYFNGYIRSRDKDSPCISCKKAPVEQAGHFYSAGHYNALRFNEDNTNGQCMRCNYYLSGNLNEYRKNLELKIGKERLEQLDMAATHKLFKWDRYSLIEKIEHYKALNKA